MARHALLIGIQDYGSGIGPMRSAPNDVDAINDALSHANVGYFHSIQAIKDEVSCAEPGKHPILSSALASEMQSWCRGHEPDDLALIYFSGQGFRDKTGHLYLAASNTHMDASGLVDSTTIPLYSLAQWLNQSSAREQVIVLDCCFSDYQGQGLSADDETLDFSALFRDVPFDHRQHRLETPQRVLLSASTAANYFSEQKSDRLSLYTRYWINGLMTGAADVEEKQWVSVADVHWYVAQQMQRALPNIQPLLLDPDQIATKIRLGKACVPSAHRQYRQAVQEFSEFSPESDQPKSHTRSHSLATAQPISAVGRQILDLQRHKLGLSSECAQGIEQQVVHPLSHYGRSLHHYREVMANLLEGRVFNEQVEHRLHDQRRRLGLCPEDVVTINQELSYLQKLRNGQQYRQALQQAIASEDIAIAHWDLSFMDSSNCPSPDEIFPMHKRTRQELSILQGMLALSNEDITLIEQDVMAERTTHHQRLAHYQQRYIQALSQGFALSPLVREELDSLQQRLGLSNDDVERVEWFVKQGNLHQPPRPQDLQSIQPNQPPATQSSDVEDLSSPDAYSLSPPSVPTPGSVQAIPPGAIPLTSNTTQLQDSNAIPSKSSASESSTSDAWASEGNTPTLFNLQEPPPTQLSKASVIPTPLGLSSAASPENPQTLLQDLSSTPEKQPSINPPTAPSPSLKGPNSIEVTNEAKTNDSPVETGSTGPEQDLLEQESLQKRIAQYEDAFVAAIARQFPVSEGDRQSLHHFQHLLGLSDSQVRHINQRIVDQVNQQEAYYHHTKIQQYVQQYVAFMEQEWPLSFANQEILSQLQRKLELHDADVKVLEQQIVAQHLTKAAALHPQAPPQSQTLENNAVSDSTALNLNSVLDNTASHEQSSLVTELMPVADANISKTSASASKSNPPPPNLVEPGIVQGNLPTEFISPSSIAPQSISQEPTSQQGVSSSQSISQEPISQPDVSVDATTHPLKAESLPPEAPPPVTPAVISENTETQGLLPTELESPDDSPNVSPSSDPSNPKVLEPTPEVVGTTASDVSSSPVVQLLTERDIDYVQLETYLRNQDWKRADEETLDMMRKATSRRVAWLDRQAILELPCTDLKTIDALWSKYSQGQFGFRAQQEIFKATQANNSNVALFGQQVGWTIWQSKWVGFKYYKQLTFALSAPPGHLPAKWFWMVPWWESVRSGGLGTGRGGCGGDASELLEAMMLYKSLD